MEAFHTCCLAWRFAVEEAYSSSSSVLQVWVSTLRKHVFVLRVSHSSSSISGKIRDKYEPSKASDIRMVISIIHMSKVTRCTYVQHQHHYVSLCRRR
jgi:hypothetical protein